MEKAGINDCCHSGYKRRAFLFIALFALVFSAVSQDKAPVTFGKISPSDFNIPQSPVVDSNSSAVIIADVGSIYFKGNNKGYFTYYFKRQTRIKIINKKAFDAATVSVLLYKNDDEAEKLESIEGSSYNLENGKVVEARLDKKDVFEEKKDKNHIEKKFTMPAVKEGSVIEYAYTIASEFSFNLPEWEFQHIRYPCLWSEYNVSIPNLLIYAFSRQGVHAFSVDKASQGNEVYRVVEQPDHSALGAQERVLSVNATLNKHRWVMKDVPFFNVENYISTPYNYIDRIQFQLAQTYNGETTKDVLNNWKNATTDLLNESDFGRPLRPDYLDFSRDVKSIIGNESDDLEKAKEIYHYIQTNINCTNHYNKYIKTSLREVIKKRNGDVGEVNLLLAAMLRDAGIHADPVLLSTTEYGFNSPSYPILQRLNYVLCWSVIKGQAYFLDASQPMLGFGRVAQNCYNGHARIICERDSASVYFMADSIRESKLTSVLIMNGEKGNGAINGSFQSMPGYFESTDIREKISKIGQKEVLKSIQLLYGADTKIENFGIDSLKQFEQPVKLHYDFSFNHNTGDDIIYFNPMMGEEYRENPFKAAERKYPVEMPYPIDDTYIFSMEIPGGYMVDELPKSVRVAYNGNEGFFEYMIQKDESNVQLRSRIKLNKAFFDAEEYSSLRDFFAYVVKKQSEQIVFKKKK